MNDYYKLYKESLKRQLLLSIITILTILVCIVKIVMQAKQISTQKEYIECLEKENWQQVIELDSQKESEHMRILEEMRGEE